jgi:hypothetical protein
MAGLGWKTWSTGDTVTAANFQGYLQDQVIAVFATTSARDTAISSPSDGQFCYVTASTGTLYVYDNSAWTAVDLAGDIQGVVTNAASGLSGGATTGTVTLTLNLAGLTAAQSFGADGAGVDVTFHSGTAGDYLMWDASEEKLILEGTHGATALDVTDGNVVIGDGTLTIGSDGAGEDVTFHSGTSGDYLMWDASDKALEFTDSTITMNDNVIATAELKDYGETVNAIGATGGGTQDIDLTAGNVVTCTVNTSANTFTFSNPSASGKSCSFTMIITNGGSQTVNWPGTVDWAGGSAPTLTTSGVDVLVFTTVDGGTIWYGFAAGLAMA